MTSTIDSTIYKTGYTVTVLQLMIQSSLKLYWTVSGELTVCNNLLLFSRHIAVSESLKKGILDMIQREIKEFKEVTLEQHHLSGGQVSQKG